MLYPLRRPALDVLAVAWFPLEVVPSTASPAPAHGFNDLLEPARALVRRRHRDVHMHSPGLPDELGPAASTDRESRAPDEPRPQPTAAAKIRVLLADDDTLVRAGIRALLERAPDVSVVAEAIDIEEALARLPDGVDVAVLDLRRPGRSSLDLLAKTAGWPDRPPCLLLTACDDRDALVAGLHGGARGYLCKDVTIETLVAAIRALAAGQTFFQPSLTERLRLGVRRHAPAGLAPAPAALEPLTVRETEVMRLVAAGYSNREIGGLLGMADGTVKVHVSRILSKLGVRDRIQAVLRALENGVV